MWNQVGSQQSSGQANVHSSGVIGRHVQFLHRHGGLGTQRRRHPELLIESVLQDAPLLSQTLAVTAAVLLVFVSIAVIYLSTVEWRDRRRRQGPTKSSS